MAELCFHGYPHGLVSKDYQPSFPNYGSRQDVLRLGSLNETLLQSYELWRPKNGLSGASHFITINSTSRRPILIDVQEPTDAHPNSIQFSFGIAEQCSRHEKILNFLMSGSSEAGRSGLDFSLLYDLLGLQTFALSVPQTTFAPDHKLCFHDVDSQSSLIYPTSEFYSQKPLEDFLSDLTNTTEITVFPNGQVSFTGPVTEMKDILSVVSEYSMSRSTTKLRKQSMLVPSFGRLDGKEARALNASKLETLKVSPLKSPDKIKLKPSPKKKSSKNFGKDRNLYRKNFLHACESFLSIMVDKNRHAKTAILSLKKSSPELPQLLTQLSASIAGTGLAVLFSVICRVASGTVALCASKLFYTGLGVGLVWLSWAVNRLRDTLIQISKTSGKLVSVEEEMMKNLDRNVNEIYFRLAILMAVALLRFA